MSLLTDIVNTVFAQRLRQIDRFRGAPAQVQREQLSALVERGARTAYGRSHGMAAGWDYEAFRRHVPVCEYPDLSPFVSEAMTGRADVLWPGRTRYFAKSSGTTSSRSKFIPVTGAGLRDSHMRGPRDVLALFSDLYPGSKVLSGKMLTLGGSKALESDGEAEVGDLSAILIDNTPWWAASFRVPSVSTALIPDFERKVEAICRQTVGRNVTSFAGVPSWNLVLMNRVMEFTGKSDLHQVWPDMELFVHGGISFKPYRDVYRELLPDPKMKYMETYNASEGFFAIADTPGRDDMLLMLDYGVFYEFLPMSHLGDPSRAVPVEAVETGVDYAMIITTSNGLWRYMIGDTVEFTGLAPHRIRITGRTQQFVNAFGEEVMVGNADGAIEAACRATGAEVEEYTMAPVFMEARSKGSHEWVVEFRRAPRSEEEFAAALDKALQSLNSDYEAKRAGDTTLYAPRLTVVPRGTFMRWMAGRGKLGGQNKVPRLSGRRTYVEQIKETV